MGTAWVECWKCDECTHRWIKTEIYPSHCASSKCRSRKWDKGGTNEVRDDNHSNKQVADGVSGNLGKRERVEGLRDLVRDIQSNPLGEGHERNEGVGSDPKDSRSDSQPVMCSYHEWSTEIGEEMQCGLAEHSMKQKHG